MLNFLSPEKTYAKNVYRNTAAATTTIHLITSYGLTAGKTNPNPKIKSIPKTLKEIDIKKLVT